MIKGTCVGVILKASRKEFHNGTHLCGFNTYIVAQTEYGYTWLRDETMSLETIQKLDLGVRLVLHGFLVFFHVETRTSETEVKEDLKELYDHFEKTPKSLEELGKKLKEHLALLSFVVVDNEYGLPMDLIDAKSDTP